MNAITLDVQWAGGDREQAIPLVNKGVNALIRIGIHPGPHRCPSCGSLVYSRRHKRCGVCEEELPAECLFTPNDTEKIEGVLRLERLRHKAWLRKRSAS